MVLRRCRYGEEVAEERVCVLVYVAHFQFQNAII